MNKLDIVNLLYKVLKLANTVQDHEKYGLR